MRKRKDTVEKSVFDKTVVFIYAALSPAISRSLHCLQSPAAFIATSTSQLLYSYFVQQYCTERKWNF